MDGPVTLSPAEDARGPVDLTGQGVQWRSGVWDSTGTPPATGTTVTTSGAGLSVALTLDVTLDAAAAVADHPAVLPVVLGDRTPQVTAGDSSGARLGVGVSGDTDRWQPVAQGPLPRLGRAGAMADLRYALAERGPTMTPVEEQVWLGAAAPAVAATVWLPALDQLSGSGDGPPMSCAGLGCPGRAPRRHDRRARGAGPRRGPARRPPGGARPAAGGAGLTVTVAAPPRGLSVRREELVHIYRAGGTEVVAVHGVDLDVAAGERLALLGPSGSGKSTLLALMGGLLPPSAGRVFVGAEEISRLGQAGLLRLRADRVGIVLQGAARNLLAYASPLDNVRFAQRSSGRAARRQGMRPAELLDTLGLSSVAAHALTGLSGGEQQRVALAVAVANGPGLLLADEPTSQLDHEARDAVLDLLEQVNAHFGTTVVVVTHDPDVGARLDRTVSMRFGQEGRLGEQFAVVGKDGTVHLPDHVLADWPPGTLVRIDQDGADLRLRRRTP